MATRSRSQTKAQVSVVSAATPDSANVLVSGHGIVYQSHKSKGSIVFDREIVPGIFVPSIGVSNELSEEYRSVRGTLGAMVYGSQKREMTLKEIHDLKLDDPRTVDREMHRMVGPKSGLASYDVVSFPPSSIQSHKLKSDIRADLRRAIGQLPSDHFIREVERSLGHLLWGQEQVKNAHPSNVQARIAGVVQKIDALQGAIDSLDPTVWEVISRAQMRERLKGRRTITGNEIQGLLTLYRRHVAEAGGHIARGILTRGAKGRMPGYAELVFATDIAQQLHAETGKRPTSTRARGRNEGPGRDSPFTQVLKILLSAVSRKPRKDVEALARRALKQAFPSDG